MPHYSKIIASHVILNLLRQIQFTVDKDVVKVYCDTFNNTALCGIKDTDDKVSNALLAGDTSQYKQFIKDSVDNKLHAIINYADYMVINGNSEYVSDMPITVVNLMRDFFKGYDDWKSEVSIVGSRLKAIRLSMQSGILMNTFRDTIHRGRKCEHTNVESSVVSGWMAELREIISLDTHSNQSMRQEYETKFDAAEVAIMLTSYFFCGLANTDREYPLVLPPVDQCKSYLPTKNYYTRAYDSVSVDAIACMTSKQKYSFGYQTCDCKKSLSLQSMAWIAIQHLEDEIAK